MYYTTKQKIKKYFVDAAWIIGIIVVVYLAVADEPFEFLQSERSSNGVIENVTNSYRCDSKTLSCPICNGTGHYLSDDIFMSQMNCWACLGKGQVPFEEYSKLINMPVRDNDRQHLCGACGGSGRCPVCGAFGKTKYGDMQYCKTCGDTGKCAWCHGSGLQN